MLKIGAYRVFENEEDFYKYYSKERGGRVCGAAYHRNPEENVYPLYLGYSDSWDPRFCGDYYPVEKSVVKDYLNSLIKSYEEMLNNLP